MNISQRQWLLAIAMAAGLHLLLAMSIWMAHLAGAPRHDTPRGVMVSLEPLDAGPPPNARAARAPVEAATPTAPQPSAPPPEAAADIGPEPADNPSATEIAPRDETHRTNAKTGIQNANTPAIASAQNIEPGNAAQPVEPQVEVTAHEVNLGSQSKRAQANSNGAYGHSAESTDDYIVRLRAWLSRHKEYPRTARRRQITGTVRLYLVIDRSGQVVTHRIQKSSGSAILDRAAQQMLARSEPLPRIPASMQRNRLELVVPVVFTLH